jgi:hypothetical protein
MKNILILLVSISSFYACSQTANTKVFTNLSSEEFQKQAKSDPNNVIIDLRTTEEINKGYIKGAIQIDFLAKDAEAQIEKLDKNKTYYVYCQSGGRSGDAAEYMEKHGFKKVFNLEKGFTNWKSKGLPVEKK